MWDVLQLNREYESYEKSARRAREERKKNNSIRYYSAKRSAKRSAYTRHRTLTSKLIARGALRLIREAGMNAEAHTTHTIRKAVTHLDDIQQD